MSEQLIIRIPQDRGVLYDIVKYPAGEIQVRLTDAGLLAAVKSSAYEIVANPIPDVIELAQLADALNVIKDFRARVCYLPYMPFGRADRRFKVGDTYAILVYSKLLKAMGFTQIITFDAHSKITGLSMENAGMQFLNIDPVHSDDQIGSILQILNGYHHNIALVRPDKGSIGRYDLDVYNRPILQGDKVRDPITGKLSGFTIDPAISEFDAALVIDDICDGGGTFIGLGEEIKRYAPDIKLYLYVSHGIFSQGEERLKEVFEELFTSGYGYNNGLPKEVIG